MRLTRTGIGLLTAQYRSVLKKCALINAGLFLALAPSVASADTAEDIGIKELVITQDIYANSSWRIINDTSYMKKNLFGGNYIKSYYNRMAGTMFGFKTTVTLSDNNTYNIFSHTGGIGRLATIVDETAWIEINGLWYNPGLWDDPSNKGGSRNKVSENDKALIINSFKENVVWNAVTSNFTQTITRNNISLADNIAILDDVIGQWSDGKYIKKFDSLEYDGNASTGYKTSTLGANLQALDYALDNNYYRKLKISSPHNALITCIYL